MTDQPIIESHIAHEATITAAVNAPARTILFTPEGTALEVASDQADFFIQHYGFTRQQLDVPAQRSELLSLFDAAKTATDRWTSGLNEVNEIDLHPDSAYVAACTAFEALTQAWGTLHRGANQLYPVVNNAAPTDEAAETGAPI